jgi:hypothetical protein
VSLNRGALSHLGMKSSRRRNANCDSSPASVRSISTRLPRRNAQSCSPETDCAASQQERNHHQHDQERDAARTIPVAEFAPKPDKARARAPPI